MSTSMILTRRFNKDNEGTERCILRCENKTVWKIQHSNPMSDIICTKHLIIH